MREHPIPPVTEPLQYRAIGIVRGAYRPDDPQKFTRGVLIDKDGVEIEAVVLGKVLSLMRRHLSMDRSHLWVVYPRCRSVDQLHLQIAGIWEPSTLDKDKNKEETLDELNRDEKYNDQIEEGDDYFSIRGELIYTKPNENEIVIKIRQKVKQDGSRKLPFKIQLKGQIPLAHLRNFVELRVRRIGQELHLESYDSHGLLTKKIRNDVDKFKRSERSGLIVKDKKE